MIFKRTIFILLCILFAMFGAITLSAGEENTCEGTPQVLIEQDENCSMAISIAKEGPRYLVIKGEIVGVVITEGECSGKVCVLEDRVMGCGWIEQDVDIDNDKYRDATLVFKPILD